MHLDAINSDGYEKINNNSKALIHYIKCLFNKDKCNFFNRQCYRIAFAFKIPMRHMIKMQCFMMFFKSLLLKQQNHKIFHEFSQPTVSITPQILGPVKLIPGKLICDVTIRYVKYLV